MLVDDGLRMTQVSELVNNLVTGVGLVTVSVPFSSQSLGLLRSEGVNPSDAFNLHGFESNGDIVCHLCSWHMQ